MIYKRILSCAIFLFAWTVVGVAWADGFTQQDRNMLIRLVSKVEQLEKRMDRMDHRMDRMDHRMDRIEQELRQIRGEFRGELQQIRASIDTLWLGYIVGLIGFVALLLWDRRTAFRKERAYIRKIVDVLLEYGQMEDRMSKILRRHSLSVKAPTTYPRRS